MIYTSTSIVNWGMPTGHQYRWNANKSPDNFQVRDIVKYHVQVNKNTNKLVLQKLSYISRGPFRTINYCGSNLYDTQQYNDENGVVRKYKVAEIYLLLSEIYPHEPLDKTYE